MIALARQVQARVPGSLLAGVIALAATFVSTLHGGPQLLYALFFGVAFHYLSHEPRTRPGIEFCSRTVLRLGVGLLGARITASQIIGLGWTTALIVIAAVVTTILCGHLLARRLGLSRSQGILAGGAVAICGASAALAIASLLPKHKHAERDASFTVIGVTALSTLAMILYPIAAGAFGFNEHAAGIFIGATIHDVAQVVGAGYSISQDAGDTATIVKLLRVAMLLPVCVVIGLGLHVRGSAAAHAAPVLPWFAVVFAALVAVGSMGWIPADAVDAGSTFSRWCLVTAIAAIGMKTSLKSLVDMGLKPVMLLVAETLLLAAGVAIVVAWK